MINKKRRGPGRPFGSGENNPRFRSELHARADGNSLESLAKQNDDCKELSSRACLPSSVAEGDSRKSVVAASYRPNDLRSLSLIDKIDTVELMHESDLEAAK
jgi:hypothetical protein